MRAETSLTVKHAELVGSSGIMEDRIFIGKKSVIVLDGATQTDQTIEQTGGWMADQIGQRFSNYIEDSDDDSELTELLAQAIAETRDEFNLVPGKSPTTTVSATRFTSQSIDLLVLGDSPALSQNLEAATVEVLEDRRLDVAANTLIKPTIPQDGGKEWSSYYESLASLRNRPEGFWIAGAEPSAALHSKVHSAAPDSKIVLCTDGVSAMVNSYNLVSWRQLFEEAQQPGSLGEAIQEIENADPHRFEFPRSKVSDDKLVAYVGWVDQLT